MGPIDPSVAVWITLAVNIAGVLAALGAWRQRMKDTERRMAQAEIDLDTLRDTKLAVEDYRREYGEMHKRVSDVDRRAGERTNEVVVRVQRLEDRPFTGRH